MMGRLALQSALAPQAAFSTLYAINTLGAVAGAALTGFVLIHFLGMLQTLWIAALLNFVVALAAARGSRAEAPLNDAPSTADGAPTRWYWLAIGCAGTTGAASLALE